MFTGSASEYVSKMRIVSFAPTVTSLLPFGVYARKVGPLGSVKLVVGQVVVNRSFSFGDLRAGRRRGASPTVIVLVGKKGRYIVRRLSTTKP